jgi:hypothetical protein
MQSNRHTNTYLKGIIKTKDSVIGKNAEKTKKKNQFENHIPFSSGDTEEKRQRQTWTPWEILTS